MERVVVTFLILLIAVVANAQSTGTLQVSGEVGKSQIFHKVKAVRCEAAVRGKCDDAIFLSLNKAHAVKAGSYVLGFENSIHPGWVNVDAGQAVELKLEKLTVPSEITGDKIKVYRDLSAKVEQNKILFTMYAMNRHLFRLDRANFGDLYLTGAWERDVVQRFTYEACAKIANYKNAPADAVAVCQGWNTATNYAGLKDLYKFNADGTMVENWVTFPGDIVASKHARYLVSTPMTTSDFVAVFPGVYAFQGSASKKATSVKAGQFSESF